MLVKLLLLLLLTITPTLRAQGPEALKPLFGGPIHDGTADPTIIWNRAARQW
jgi:hypothetical protein